MTLAKLPSGRYRARVYHQGKDHNVSDVLGLPKGTTWPRERDARAAREEARKLLQQQRTPAEITVEAWWQRWTTDPLFARPKESTNIHNRERTGKFAKEYGKRRLYQIDERIVGEWLAGGKRNGTVKPLAAMFNDAMTPQAGCLIDRNPFAGLKLDRSKGRSQKQPPSQQQLESMLIVARDITPPSFAAYLEFACFSGARPGELDALRWENVDFEESEVHLREQWNTKTRTFTTPKYGPYTISLVDRARDVLLRLPHDQTREPWVFLTVMGHHYTPSTRSYHWNRVRCAAGMPDMQLYLATRHYFGWYALNVLELEPHIIAQQLGHRDGGRLVTSTYGHPDARVGRARLRNAFNQAGKVRPLKVIREESA